MTRRRASELQGELRTFPPSLLFQMMALGRVRGVLIMHSPAGVCEVFFRDGQLVFARDGSRKQTLGEELVKRGLILRTDSEAAGRERERHRDGPRIGAILVGRGKIRQEDLEALVRERIKDAICKALELREGRFTFESGVEPEDEDILLDMHLESLLLECLTRLDDARRNGADAGERRE